MVFFELLAAQGINALWFLFLLYTLEFHRSWNFSLFWLFVLFGLRMKREFLFSMFAFLLTVFFADRSMPGLFFVFFFGLQVVFREVMFFKIPTFLWWWGLDVASECVALRVSVTMSWPAKTTQKLKMHNDYFPLRRWEVFRLCEYKDGKIWSPAFSSQAVVGFLPVFHW